MLDFVDNDTVNFAVQFISYFLFSFTGAFLKEIHNANNRADYEFTAYKVIYGTLIATFGSMLIVEYYFENNINRVAQSFISLVLGLVGYELFIRLSTLAGIQSLIIGVKDTQEALEKKETDSKPEPTHDSEPSDNNNICDSIDHKYIPDITAKKHENE